MKKNNAIEKTEIISKILENAELGIWTIELEKDKPSRFYGNTTMLELIAATPDMSPEECFNQWYSRIDSNYYELVNEAVKKITNNEKAEVEYPWLHPQKGRVYVRCGGVLDKTYTKGVRFSGYHQDVTQRIMITKEKEWLEDLNADITNSLGKFYDGIYRLNLETQKIMVIKGMLDKKNEGKFLSYDEYTQILKDELKLEDYKKLQEDISIEQLINLGKEKKERIIKECKRIKKNGEEVWYSYTIFFDNPSENHRNVIIAIQNITELKEEDEKTHKILQDAYESAKQADMAKTIFLSRMSHDIRTPMNVIIGMTNIAQKQLNNSLEVSKCLNKIASASKILLNLVNQVLDMSKIESGQYEQKLEVFSIRDLLDTFSKIYEENFREKNLRFIIEEKALQHQFIKCDYTSMQRIFSNLISNAIKYSNIGGEIKVIIEELQFGGAHSRGYKFVVEDNGIGMNKWFLEKVFEPFTRR